MSKKILSILLTLTFLFTALSAALAEGDGVPDENADAPEEAAGAPEEATDAPEEELEKND